MISVLAKTPDEITQTLCLEKKFQGKQIYQAVMRGVESFEEMTNLSIPLRQKLSQNFCIYKSTVKYRQEDDEGNIKLALEFEDQSIVECVLLTNREGELTACISSQVGCAMGCKFCRTGTLKLKRNLEAVEIIEQFMRLQQLAEDKITHVVFMGMGEPFANFDNVLKTIEFLHNPEGLNISHRRITISTCGVVPGILALAKTGLPVRLAVSLVTADNEKRSSLMPVNRSFNLETLKDALKTFQKANNRRFTLEYCMISGQNIAQDDAQKLADFCRGLDVIVNLIPFNSCPELDFKTPDKSEISSFTNELDKRNINYTIRISRGRSIRGACGQLAGRRE